MAFEKWKERNRMKKIDREYKREHGEEALKHREKVETIYSKLEAIDFVNKNNLKSKIGDYLENELALDFSLFPKFNNYIGYSNVGLPQYHWLDDNPQCMEYTVEQIPLVVAFMNQVSIIMQNTDVYDELTQKFKVNGMDIDEHPEAKLLLRNIEVATRKMETIINPVSREFQDERTKEELMKAEVMLIVKKMAENKPIELEPQRYQLESLVQLQGVMENPHVSETIKKEAKDTMELIQQNLRQEESRKKQQQAENNARAVIDASRLFHSLPNNLSMTETNQEEGRG